MCCPAACALSIQPKLVQPLELLTHTVPTPMALVMRECSNRVSYLVCLLSHVASGAAAGHVGLEELQTLAAFAKDQMRKTRSVHLSDMEPSQWGHIQKNAGTQS